MDDEKLYFRQLLAGRDFATASPLAADMQNFVYLVGDRHTGECLVVDPAWGVEDLVELVENDGLRLTGVLATHHHPDHVGGDLMGLGVVEGIRELLERTGLKVHCQREEAAWIKRMTGVSDSDLELHDGGDRIQVGQVEMTLLHTPGHTPGSQCFLLGQKLIAGDTLFLQGCGRTDLPGGDPDEMYRSIHQRLARLPDDTILYPGHLYSPEPSATLGHTRKVNYVFKVGSLEDWRRFLG